ncbi:Hypothetical_protein [Hexamita inflata]|uniref:Hypothetical_protein n=1 Tax=Hexamita inflata TaxID=28002 RepID=A0AA86UNH0_9EUKA|nr:Hypothetical protein HINF_LOCUS52980 [Hexamita inflata]
MRGLSNTQWQFIIGPAHEYLCSALQLNTLGSVQKHFRLQPFPFHQQIHFTAGNCEPETNTNSNYGMNVELFVESRWSLYRAKRRHSASVHQIYQNQKTIVTKVSHTITVLVVFAFLFTNYSSYGISSCCQLHDLCLYSLLVVFCRLNLSIYILLIFRNLILYKCFVRYNLIFQNLLSL